MSYLHWRFDFKALIAPSVVRICFFQFVSIFVLLIIPNVCQHSISHKHADYFIVLDVFVCLFAEFLMYLCDQFTQPHRGSFAGTGAIVRL